ncbi:putative CAAX prenyl protease-related protein [Hyphomicrobium sp. MC1]|nr:putative CAAX prenyl protease-related protein [Hyphomicrobium sp. MC1]
MAGMLRMLKAASHPAWPSARIVSTTALVIVEMLTIRLFTPLPDVWGIWPVIGVVQAVPKILLLVAAIFVVVGWSKRSAILAAFNQDADPVQISATAAISAAAMLAAFLARGLLAQAPPGADTFLTYLYSALFLAAITSLVLVAAPPGFWREIVTFCKPELMLALGLGVLGYVTGATLDRERGSLLSEDSWAELSDATLQLSYWILKHFDHSAFMDPATRILGAGDFSVRIFAACSGYEGMMLIAVFVVGYILIFRRSLKFPNVLMLFPLAMGAIWLLNSLRIALLVFIGANISPDIALGGFHSQFGWISFLLIAITIMTVAQKLAFFGKRSPIMAAAMSDAASAARARQAADSNPALIFLAPFIALMAGQIVTRIAAPHDYLLYPIKVVAVFAALYAFRNIYKQLLGTPDAVSALIGGIAGLLWIATDPGAGSHTPLEQSLSEFSPILVALWLAFRGIGTIIMVPIAEELAFRGYLYRVLQAAKFETVDFRAFGLVALVVSSSLFGLMHDRWLAAALAGALYALLMIRRGRIGDAITAHMTTNAVIFAWAVVAGQWSLL